MTKMTTNEEPVMGIPYNGGAGYASQAPMPQQMMMMHQNQNPNQGFFYMGENPYQVGMIPPNAIFGDPTGIPIQQTFYKDTPAPFICALCGNSGLTIIKSKPSPAAVVACMMPFMLGCCFLCPSMDCLWHKYHYCPSCNQKVADFNKSDMCAVMDPPNWTQKSFALPG